MQIPKPNIPMNQCPKSDIGGIKRSAAQGHMRKKEKLSWKTFGEHLEFSNFNFSAREVAVPYGRSN